MTGLFVLFLLLELFNLATAACHWTWCIDDGCESGYLQVATSNEGCWFTVKEYCCKTEDCVEGEWQSWSACSRTCGGGTRSRSRSLVQPQYGGRACGDSSEAAACNTNRCPGAFPCVEQDLPVDEGSHLASHDHYDLDQCEAACQSTATCNAFAWKRSGGGCYLKSGFAVASAIWGTVAWREEYNFCYTHHADLNLAAYWDLDACGPGADDQNWDWCGFDSFECLSAVSTSLCPSGTAALVSTLGSGTWSNPVTIDGCVYPYYAQYECTGVLGSPGCSTSA